MEVAHRRGFKGLLTLGVESLKIMALINGGAAVAILAYLGNIASRTPPPAHMPHMRSALLLYAAGVLATALAFIGAYATQLRLYNEERARHDGKPFRGQLTPLPSAPITAIFR